MHRKMRHVVAVGVVATLVSCAAPPDTPPDTPRNTTTVPAYDVLERTIPELTAAMAAGEVTSAGLVDAYLARIEAFDRRGPALNAMLTINTDARREADALDAERTARGPRGPLHGVPIVVKDNFDTAAMPTTAGSIALAGTYASADAFQVKRLEEAGAIILGKTNMHELAYGITTVSSMHGWTRNPYDTSRNAGGSSGGTAAAVASSFAAAGLGSDTCGSIRIPASHTALVGLRPTRGLSSRHGIVPLSRSQDVGGPLARSVVDLAILLDATAGFDPADEITALGRDRVPDTYGEYLDAGRLRGARIGVVTALFGDAAEDLPVEQVIRAALDEMAKAGAEIVELQLPGVTELFRAAATALIRLEFKFDLADYLHARPETPVRSLQEILDLGLYHAAVENQLRGAASIETRDNVEYRELQKRRDVLRATVLRALDDQRLAAIAYPTIRRTAMRLGETQTGSNCGMSSVSGLPAVTIPAGRAADGLPVGIELIGRDFDEPTLIGLAYAYEEATHHRRPPPSVPSLVTPPVRDEIVLRTAGPDTMTAEATFRFDRPHGELAFKAFIGGIPPNDILFMHLHRASPGENGPVVFILSEPGVARTTGRLTLGPQDRRALEAGLLYFDVHTTQHAAGLARAQLRRSPGP